VCEELQVSWDLVVCRACVETVVRQERWVFKVFLVFLAVSGQWGSKVHLVQLELLVPSVFVVSKEK